MEKDKTWCMILLRKWKEFRKVGRFIGGIKIPDGEIKRQMVKINYRLRLIFGPIISTLGPRKSMM